MPIHAAGIYHGASPVCVSDYFISSYTPTSTALLDARRRPIPTELKVLAAAQPNPGGRWGRLPEVTNEMKEIIHTVPSQNLIHLGDTNEPDIEGRHTTVSNVLEKLPEATILHLACHGTQDPNDPLSSGFILANGEKLTIEHLMKCRLPNAHTAILSACHTASNDAEQPDESINLSSTMMFLGFSNVVATKWYAFGAGPFLHSLTHTRRPMYDSDGPSIAKAVYSFLFRTPQGCISEARTQDPCCRLHGTTLADHETNLKQHGNVRCHDDTISTFSLAKVVDEIARDLRVVKKVPAERWATFVHIGV